jgi:hypothetical protein
MKLLAMERAVPGVTAVELKPLLEAEAARVWELYRAGIIREMYFRADRREAVLVLECGSEAEARDALDTLPLVREKLIAFDAVQLVPYDGFARLFR